MYAFEPLGWCVFNKLAWICHSSRNSLRSNSIKSSNSRLAEGKRFCTTINRIECVIKRGCDIDSMPVFHFTCLSERLTKWGIDQARVAEKCTNRSMQIFAFAHSLYYDLHARITWGALEWREWVNFSIDHSIFFAFDAGIINRFYLFCSVSKSVKNCNRSISESRTRFEREVYAHNVVSNSCICVREVYIWQLFVDSKHC
jgi:hypothetical protein